MDMNLSKLKETLKGREAWHAAVHRVAKSWTRLSDWTITKPLYNLHKMHRVYFKCKRVGHHWTTELNWLISKWFNIYNWNLSFGEPSIVSFCTSTLWGHTLCVWLQLISLAFKYWRQQLLLLLLLAFSFLGQILLLLLPRAWFSGLCSYFWQPSPVCLHLSGKCVVPHGSHSSEGMSFRLQGGWSLCP